MADEHPLDTYLDNSLSALRAHRKPVNIKICIIKTDSIERSVVDTVLLGVNHELVLDFSLVQSRVAVFYTTREAVESLREDLPVFAYGHSSYFGTWIFRPRRDMLCELEVVLRPSPFFI